MGVRRQCSCRWCVAAVAVAAATAAAAAVADVAPGDGDGVQLVVPPAGTWPDYDVPRHCLPQSHTR